MKPTEVIRIRRFRPSDQEPAKALILAGLEEHWGTLDPTLNPDLNEIAAHYADGVFLVAERGAEIVGTGALLPEDERTGRIVRMSVAGAARRQGLGSRILAQLVDHARARGYRRLVLETTSTWDDAVSFYRHHGFRVVGTRDGDTHFERAL